MIAVPVLDFGVADPVPGVKKSCELVAGTP
jgi:hypothetical protein